MNSYIAFSRILPFSHIFLPTHSPEIQRRDPQYKRVVSDALTLTSSCPANSSLISLFAPYHPPQRHDASHTSRPSAAFTKRETGSSTLFTKSRLRKSGKSILRVWASDGSCKPPVAGSGIFQCGSLGKKEREGEKLPGKTMLWWQEDGR